MSLLLVLWNESDKSLTGHLWKEIDIQIITLKISFFTKKGGREQGEKKGDQAFSRFL